MTDLTPPIVLLDAGHPGAALPDGWRVHEGFELPDTPWDLSRRRIACRGTVDGDASAARALAAVTRGAGLIVELTATGRARHRFLEDLHKLTGSPADPRDLKAPAFSADQRALLDALSAGATVTAAAEGLHISRRTANRHLATIREQLGVATTAAAVLEWNHRRERSPDAEG